LSALAAGTRLGPYEILSPLGAGGMGEVYRAKDSRLGREVAVKVLPESLSNDADRLRRFEQEARSASALNHPNIVTIYDIGQSSSGSYIAMELVQGSTLRDILADGPLPTKRMLLISAQVADGLSRAHAAGIVHRDLKPENLMVRDDGVVKILDFGLAKLASPAVSGGDTQTVTVQAFTEPGRIVGTVGYMSPEQALGETLDFRSDQFSLGAILYEMATGDRAFSRASAPETLSAIIRDEPKPLAERTPGAPTLFRWIVERCLAKSPQDRYGSTSDLARDLSTLRDRLPEASGLAASVVPPRRDRAYRGVVLGVVAAAAFATGALLTPRLGHRGSSAAHPTWRQLSFRRGMIWSGRFAPDGQTVVYSAAWDGAPVRLFSTRSGATETRELELPSGKILAISPSGELAFLRDPRFIFFFLQPGTLARAALEGGAPRDLLEGVEAADWSPDGRELAVARRIEGKTRLEYPVGKILYETEGDISTLRVSHDGAWIAFFEHSVFTSAVVAVRVADGSRRALSGDWRVSSGGIAWSPDGEEVWFTAEKRLETTNQALYAATLAGKVREVVTVPGQLRLLDVANDGRALLARWDRRAGIRVFGQEAVSQRDLSWFDGGFLDDLSSDGRTIVFNDRGATFLRATDGSPPIRLGEGYTFDLGRLSPDGKWVATASASGPRTPVLVPTGAGEIRRLEKAPACDSAEWFPDGRRILCGNAKSGVFAVDAATGEATKLPLPADTLFSQARMLSRDGSRISLIGADGEVRIVSLADGRTLRQLPAGASGYTQIGWTEDGRHVLLYRIGEVPERIQRLDLDSGKMEPWRELTLEDLAGLIRIHPVLVTPDGRHWAFSYTRVLSDLYVAEGLR
jgi:serine/threonine protein kinase/Tol biopolymer transport system component